MIEKWEAFHSWANCLSRRRLFFWSMEQQKKTVNDCMHYTEHLLLIILKHWKEIKGNWRICCNLLFAAICLSQCKREDWIDKTCMQLPWKHFQIAWLDTNVGMYESQWSVWGESGPSWRGKSHHNRHYYLIIVVIVITSGRAALVSDEDHLYLHGGRCVNHL